MLRLYPKVDENSNPVGYGGYTIRSGNGPFDLDYESEWFKDELVQEMILDIDKARWISGSVFESPVLGTIFPHELSGGVKSLILAYKDIEGTRMFATSCWGDNCAKWVSRISFLSDFSIFFTNSFLFPPEEPICAQKYTTDNWKQRDFYKGMEAFTYYVNES